MIFEEIKQAVENKFEGCKLINKTTDLEIEFENKEDYDWFYENICFPKELKEEEYPVNLLIAMSPIGDNDIIGDMNRSISFTVQNKNKLIEMLN